MITLEESLVEHGSLAKVSQTQLEWLEMPSQFFELGMVLSTVYDSFWMNMISKLWLTSRIVLMRRLFFRKFWENIFKFFKIILWCCSQLNELSFFGCPCNDLKLELRLQLRQRLEEVLRDELKVVKCKDTGLYLRYIYVTKGCPWRVHEAEYMRMYRGESED